MSHVPCKSGTVASAGIPIHVENCEQVFGGFVALKNINLEVKGGELVTLLGPSGSGKTTLLRILAGLIQPTGGRIRIGNRDITHLPAEKRDLGMVFQNYALFPHLTVFENIAFPLRVRKVPRGEIKRSVEDTLALVGLPELGRRFPGQLSGGQQQRIAIARAIVFRPGVLLMDEPLGSLDKRLRQQLQIEIRMLQKEVGITTIYVTHDQDEAFTISDRIAVMEHGKIAQIGTPSEIYRSPSNYFVADFVGDLNRFTGVVQSDATGLFLQAENGLAIRLPRDSALSGATVTCGIRPEKVCVDPDADAASYPAVVHSLSFKGSHHRAEMRLGDKARVVADLAGTSSIKEGDRIRIGWKLTDTHVFKS
jgi:putative spermidine/putrescine transport system ATP-binding protein